jgi:Spy/CpxP family protein refolding chaperone
MRHAKILCRALAALALAATLPAAAGAQARDPHRPVGGLIESHAERLGLEGPAGDAVRAIVAASGERHAAILERIDAARDRMRELLSDPTPDQAAVMDQAEVIGDLETELHKNRLQAILDIRGQLSPEQRAELMRIREEEHARRDAEHGECMQKHGEHGEHGPPPGEPGPLPPHRD